MRPTSSFTFLVLLLALPAVMRFPLRVHCMPIPISPRQFDDLDSLDDLGGDSDDILNGVPLGAAAAGALNLDPDTEDLLSQLDDNFADIRKRGSGQLLALASLTSLTDGVECSCSQR